jgi:pimeloyl-ACP methyl ester carboxylesterase
MPIWKKIILSIFVLCFVIAAILCYIVIENVLPYSSIKPQRVNVAALPEFQNGVLPNDYGLDFETFDVVTKDSLKLKGYWIKAEKPRCTLILVHGIADCKEHFYPFCKKLKDIGCQTIIFDLRAHGQSEGLYCTFGYKEKTDIAILIDSLVKKKIQQPIGIYGNSLGGAIALQVLGENKQLKFGIIESTFDEFPKVALEYGEDFIGIRSTLLTNHVIKHSGDIAGFDPFEVKPVVSCTHITCPIFMAHGVLDDKIPFSFGQNNFNALKTANKQFIPVAGAGHFDLQQRGADTYWADMKDFILKNTQNTEGGSLTVENQEVKPVNTELEDKLIDIVHDLPIVKAREISVEKLTKGKRHLTYWVNQPDSEQPNIYIVVVAEDNGMSFATHFRFHIDEKNLKVLNPNGQSID